MRLNSVHSIFSLPLFSFVALLVCATHPANAYEHECGTIKLFESLINKQKQSPYYAQTILIDKESDSVHNEKCTVEDFYDSVYTIETQHFQVLYTLIGPHATTKEFADSTAAIFEQAWNFYANKYKMRMPKGPSTSYHYRKKIKDGLYPIEIIEMNRVRNNVFNGSGCDENFAITYPLDQEGTSQIFMENDFKITCSSRSNQDTIIVHGDTCTYPTPSYSMRNITHNFSYADEWVKGLRVTTFHEFYHAIQLRYLNMFVNRSFWFEASATGFEEITNPDVDDYFRYIPDFFSRTGQSLSDNFKNYGASTFLLYLHNNVSKDLDKSIWESYANNPNKNFEYQLTNALKPLKLDADSIFHDYAIRLSFSGDRSKDTQKKNWIYSDQPQWSNAQFLFSENIQPSLKSLAFEFYRVPQGYTPATELSDFIGKATVILYHDGKASIHPIQNAKTLDSLASTLAMSDSSTWIFSRLGESESIPITNNNAEPHAFPVPWREGSLCFAPLPHDKKVFEIRNRRGDLVVQQKYDGTSFCMQESQVKSMMAPGIYRFRVGNKGKTTSFIIIY